MSCHVPRKSECRTAAPGPRELRPEKVCFPESRRPEVRVRPISLLRLSLLRFVDSKLLGNSLWTCEFHLNSILCSARVKPSEVQNLSTETGRIIIIIMIIMIILIVIIISIIREIQNIGRALGICEAAVSHPALVAFLTAIRDFNIRFMHSSNQISCSSNDSFVMFLVV